MYDHAVALNCKNAKLHMRSFYMTVVHSCVWRQCFPPVFFVFFYGLQRGASRQTHQPVTKKYLEKKVMRNSSKHKHLQVLTITRCGNNLIKSGKCWPPTTESVRMIRLEEIKSFEL